MNILLIDNTRDPDCRGSADLCRSLRASLDPAADVTLRVRRAPEEDLPEGPEPFDRILMSGSSTPAGEEAPWIDRLLAFTRRAVELGKPLLGICYGHQILARALGGSEAVGRAAVAEFGWTEIELLEDSALFRGMPRRFHSFSSHFDEVVRLPAGMRRLARSADCGIQACGVEGRPAFGVQFHPEKDPAGARRSLEERRRKGAPSRPLDPAEGGKFYDPRVAGALFGNFLKL